MNYDNKQQLIKKLIDGTISTEEEKYLLNLSFIEKQMKSQWERIPDSLPDSSQQQRMWKSICKSLWDNKTEKQIQFYKTYSIVATLLLLVSLGLSIIYSTFKHENTNTFIVTSGIQSIKTVSLPDGTTVQLGSGSTLQYPSEFTGRKREVTLKGQAFFDIIPDKKKTFIVKTPVMDVQALGTAFELFCYESENKSEAILLNGKIKISITNPETCKRIEYSLLPDEKFIFEKDTRKVSKQIVNADNYSAWRKQKILTFENETLAMIIPRLEQWYGGKIMCQKGMAEQYRFSFKVRDESLEKILFMLGESSPLKYQKEHNGDYSIILHK